MDECRERWKKTLIKSAWCLRLSPGLLIMFKNERWHIFFSSLVKQALICPAVMTVCTHTKRWALKAERQHRPLAHITQTLSCLKTNFSGCSFCGSTFLNSALLSNFFMLEKDPSTTEVAIHKQSSQINESEFFSKAARIDNPPVIRCIWIKVWHFSASGQYLGTTGCQSVDLRELAVRSWVILEARIG